MPSWLTKPVELLLVQIVLLLLAVITLIATAIAFFTIGPGESFFGLLGAFWLLAILFILVARGIASYDAQAEKANYEAQRHGEARHQAGWRNGIMSLETEYGELTANADNIHWLIAKLRNAYDGGWLGEGKVILYKQAIDAYFTLRAARGEYPDKEVTDLLLMLKPAGYEQISYDIRRWTSMANDFHSRFTHGLEHP